LCEIAIGFELFGGNIRRLFDKKFPFSHAESLQTIK